MADPMQSRPLPVPPALEVWSAAVADHTAGRVIKRGFSVPDGDDVAVAFMTETFVRAWRAMAHLSQWHKLATNQACVLLATDITHPSLAAVRVSRQPVGGWMAAPCDGITISWMPHWESVEAPVLMTLEARSAH